MTEFPWSMSTSNEYIRKAKNQPLKIPEIDFIAKVSNYSSSNVKYNQKYIDEMIRKTKNLLKLEKLYELEYNWNGNGAEPIDINLIRSVKNIIENIVIQPKIFPTARDSIQLEYEKDNAYLELEVFKRNIKCFMIRNDGSESICTISQHDMNSINRQVKEFYEINITIDREAFSGRFSNGLLG